MNKYVLPYEYAYDFVKRCMKAGVEEAYMRSCLEERGAQFTIWKEKDIGWKVVSCNQNFLTKDHAMTWLDNYLIAQGYVFISPEKAAKLRVLL